MVHNRLLDANIEMDSKYIDWNGVGYSKVGRFRDAANEFDASASQTSRVSRVFTFNGPPISLETPVELRLGGLTAATHDSESG